MKYLVFSIKTFCLILILYTLYFILNTPVSAQQVSLSITPPLLELVIKPGKSIMVAYTLKNAGDPTILTSRLVNFEPKDNLGNIRLKEDLRGPIRFELDNADLQLERPFFLKTGASQQLLLRIRAPVGAPSGDYYYTLLAVTTPQNNAEGITIPRAKVTIGSNILVTITDSGVVEVKPKIVLFDLLNKVSIFGRKINLYDSFDRIPLVLIIGNRGKNLIKPEGEINLTGNFGEKLTYQIVPKNILAESERLVEATPSSQLATNHQKPVTLIISGFFIGLYRISSQIAYGENSPNTFAHVSFFAFPFKLLSVLIVVIVITVYLIKRYLKKEDED